MLGILGFAFCTPFLPFFVEELGVKSTGSQAFWAGIVLSSSGLTLAVFAPVWGILADKYGRKLMVCRAMFAGFVILTLMSFSRTVPQLIFFRLLQGVFCGTLAASIAMVASVVPQSHSGFALGMMQAAVFIGNALGPFVGGITADLLGYRHSFRIGALMTLVGGLMILFGTKEKKQPQVVKEAKEPTGFMSIIVLPGFLISVFVMFGVRLSNSLSNPSFPLIIKDIILNSPSFDGINEVIPNLNSITGSVMAGAALAAALSAGMLGYIGDKVGRRRILIACCIGACLASIGHYLSHSLLSLSIMRILFGFSVAGMLPAANAMIHSIIDSRSIGKAYGLATSLSMLGTAMGPTIGGLIGKYFSLRLPFMVTALFQLTLALLVLRFFHEKITRSGSAVKNPLSGVGT